MQLANLLRETLDVDCDEVWENERTRHPSGCSGCACIRWDCQFGRSSQCSIYSGLTVLTAQSGTGCTNYQRSRAARRRQRRRGSRSTRRRSRFTARKSGCTLRSTQNRSYFSKSTCTAAAGLTPRRPREQRSRAAHQNASRSEDGVFAPFHRETRYRRNRVSRRCWRLSD